MKWSIFSCNTFPLCNCSRKMKQLGMRFWPVLYLHLDHEPPFQRFVFEFVPQGPLWGLPLRIFPRGRKRHADWQDWNHAELFLKLDRNHWTKYFQNCQELLNIFWLKIRLDSRTCRVPLREICWLRMQVYEYINITYLQVYWMEEKECGQYLGIIQMNIKFDLIKIYYG